MHSLGHVGNLSVHPVASLVAVSALALVLLDRSLFMYGHNHQLARVCRVVQLLPNFLDNLKNMCVENLF